MEGSGTGHRPPTTSGIIRIRGVRVPQSGAQKEKMPSLLPFLTRLFLGIPGGILWITGGVYAGFLGFIAIPKDGPLDLMVLRNLGLAAAAVCIGYLMVAADGIISRTARYRVSGAHLPSLIGMELGIQLSAILSLCFTVGCLVRLGSGDLIAILALPAACILSIFGMCRLYQLLETSIGRWEEEHETLQAGEPPAEKSSS